MLYNDWYKHCERKRTGLRTVHIQCNVHSWHTGRQQALSSNKDNLSLAETLLLGFISSNLVIPVNATLSFATMCKDIHVTLHKLKTMFFKHDLTIRLWNSASWKPAITSVKSSLTCIDLTLTDLSDWWEWLKALLPLASSGNWKLRDKCKNSRNFRSHHSIFSHYQWNQRVTYWVRAMFTVPVPVTPIWSLKDTKLWDTLQAIIIELKMKESE